MLTPTRFSELVATLPYKKELPEAVYLHRETLQQTCPPLSEFVCAVAQALKLADEEWHLVKLSKRDFRLSLLSYPTFFVEAYPSLAQSVTVDLAKLKQTVTRYEEHDNPPILHRKETMLVPDHPMAEQCRQITEEGELAGLYEQPRMIGFKQSWLRLIARHGYQLVDGRLFRQSALPETAEDPQIDRHKTALTRYQLSAPMKMLVRHGYLNGEYSLFDYGCGRGDDLRELEAHGIAALGWDPNFRPDGELVPSQLVNLGYVINVIEDRDERTEALIKAWELTQSLLVVSAMLANDDFIAQFTPYRDGVVTSRNTFQKYYNQSELRGFIERTLDEVPLAVGPGLFYVFKDKEEEQRFLSERQRRHHGWRQLSSPPLERISKQQHLLQTHSKLFEAFWQQTLSLGRLPASEEFEQMEELKQVIGSPTKALRLIETQEGKEQLEQARRERTEDLSVYLALTLFEKRRPYSRMNAQLKRDIKAFFGDYRSALEQTKDLLYAIADQEQIEAACIMAHNNLPASLLHSGHSLILHKDYLQQLPALLRVYVGAATQLYGELEDIDLIKVHITSGKVSLMGYDDFEKPIPYLVERVKIKMAEQDVDFFDYVDEHKRPPLLNKSYLMAPDHTNATKQRSLELRLGKLLGMELSQDLNLSRIELQAKLKKLGKQVKGHRVCTVKT